MHLQFNYTVQIGDSGVLALIGESDIRDSHPNHWAFFMAQIPVGKDRNFLLYLNEHFKYALGTSCTVIDTGREEDVRILFGKQLTDGPIRDPKNLLLVVRHYFRTAIDKAKDDVEEWRRVEEAIDRDETREGWDEIDRMDNLHY